MKNLWKRIETWYQENAPEILTSFNPPATDEALANLEKVVGFQLPKDFVESYKIHDGQDIRYVFNAAIIDPDSQGLNSIERIIEVYQLYQGLNAHATEVTEGDVDKGIKPIYWNEKWLPIIEDGLGNTYLIDMDPAENGTMGQIILRNHEGPSYDFVAKSFKIWVKEFVDGNLDD